MNPGEAAVLSRRLDVRLNLGHDGSRERIRSSAVSCVRSERGCRGDVTDPFRRSEPVMSGAERRVEAGCSTYLE